MNPDAGVDAYLYHLRLPFMYGLRHRVFSVWHQDHAHVPQLWEMLYAVFPRGLAASGAQFLSAFAALAAFRTAASLAGTSWPMWAALLLVFTSPLVLGVGTLAHTDLPMVWLGLASFRLASRGRPAVRWFGGGLIAGLACSVKYAAFPVLAAFGCTAAAAAWRRRRIVPLLAAGGGCLAVFWPWLAWNALATGNPLHPFFWRWTPWALAPPEYARRVSEAVFRRSWAEVLRSGWNAYVRSSPALFLSPALGAAAPCVVLPGGRGGLPRGTGWWLAGGTAAWAVFLADERFALPLIPVLALCVAARLVSRTPRGSAWLALLLVVNACGAFRQTFLPTTRLWTALGLASRDAWWRSSLGPAPGYWDAAAWLNARSAPADRVLIVSDYKSHGFARECIHEHVVDFPARLITILRSAPPDAGRIAARFRQLGVRWMVYLPARAAERLASLPEFYAFDPPRARAYASFWGRLGRRRAVFPGAAVYEINRGTEAGETGPDLPGVQEMIFSAVRQAYERGGVAEARAEHAR
ncbi:MAG: hypothetical protein AAB368_14775, partial [bacterium]